MVHHVRQDEQLDESALSNQGLMPIVRNGRLNAAESITSPVRGKFGIIDISDDSAYQNSGSVLNCAEGIHILVQNTFLKSGGGNIVKYLALVMTKLKTEQARKWVRNGEDYFVTKLPVSCIENLEKALHMCMQKQRGRATGRGGVHQDDGQDFEEVERARDHPQREHQELQQADLQAARRP